jgi:hypothetical protein
MAGESDWLSELPPIVRARFRGLNKYVLAVLDEEYRRDRLHHGDIRRIQLEVAIRVMFEFFSDGAEAAERAVDALHAIGISGFSVGSEVFEGRNHAVIRGKLLAERLAAATGTDARVAPRTELPLRLYIVERAKELAGARRVG